MIQNNPKSNIRIIHSRRASAEVISSLLLVAITVVGAVILTSFLDETFVAGSLSQSGADSTIKTIKLIKYDSRDGGNLLGLNGLNNTGVSNPVDQKLCRESCLPNTNPKIGGTEFLVIQVENQSVNPIYLHNVWLGNATHSWDSSTADIILDPNGSSNDGSFPSDGRFSVFPVGSSEIPTDYTQKDNQIQSGQTVNILIKLDNVNPDIPSGKTIRTQFNVGANHMSEFLIESGGAQ